MPSWLFKVLTVYTALSSAMASGAEGRFLQELALDDARIRVMNLPAMARITKLPLEMLEALRAESPAFAPGVANFFKLGGLHSVWTDSLSEQLQAALDRRSDGDRRREDGAARQGRNMALAVSRKVSSSM